jgi:hypothetical protein
MANTTGRKYGGRISGTPNRITKDVRQVLIDILNRELETLNVNLLNLTPKDRIDVIIKLLPYVIPKASDQNTPSEKEQRKLVIMTLPADADLPESN